MVLNIRKTIFAAFLAALALGQYSCDEIYFIDCNTCIRNEPINVDIYADISEYLGDTPCLVNVYLGKLDDGVLVSSFETTESKFIPVSLILNTEYTVTATYTVNGKEYTAVDSARPNVILDNETCEHDCYYFTDDMVNLKLKYL